MLGVSVLAVVPLMQSEREKKQRLPPDGGGELRSWPRDGGMSGRRRLYVGALMYEAFYGFRERPFDLVPNPRFLVMTSGHREALSNLEYGIASRKGITLLIGEAGLGKTTLRPRRARSARQERALRVSAESGADA